MLVSFQTFFIYCFIYATIKNALPQSKARVYVSLLNSIVLSLYSYKTFYNMQLHNVSYFLTQEPNYNLTSYTLGYFSVDLFLGHFFDRKHLNLLTGYIHHSVFIGFILYINMTHQPNLIYIFVPFEIPTMLLDMHHLYKNEFLSILFGTNFFIFRILYNIYIVNSLWQYNQVHCLISSLLCCLHLYWFKQYIEKECIIRTKLNLT
jgi:hypothetical protein